MDTVERVVIVGAGFGGLAAAKALAGKPVEVVLIDRTNHHLFQPLLYQVATAALSPADVASATRSLFGKGGNVKIMMEEVSGVDRFTCEVITAGGGRVSYDHLILATGAEYSFFGNDAWSEHAPVLKTLEDALGIRERLLAAFEEAERTSDEAEVDRLLTFVIVGAGPTGVEMAGAIAELGRSALARGFTNVKEHKPRILLVEAGQRVLGAFDVPRSRHALDALRSLGVTVQLGQAVEAIDHDGIIIGDARVRSANVIWCAGTQARDAGNWINAPIAQNRTVLTNPDCTVVGHENIYAIGDVSCHRDANDNVLPGLAPVAKQQGRYVAKQILRAIAGREPAPRFKYTNWGTMAVIGRSRAIADFGWLKLSGFIAWLTWSCVHLLLLVDFRSRLSVYLSWTWAWFTRDRAARLLTRDHRGRNVRSPKPAQLSRI